MATDERPPSSAEGAAFPWILEHLLTYPGTYEMPLRTMYTLNVTTQSQQSQSPTSPTFPSTPGNAFPRSPTTAQDDSQNMTTATAAAQLRANLMTHISQLPSQPTSLPPAYVTSFVRKCFPSELDQVNFPQALTAMDYLKDLETRRRREVVAALDKLGIEKDDIADRDKLAKKFPGVLQWVLAVEEKEKTIEAMYTQVYLGVRRWTLINELSLTPFNKANCIAMLNTLYPPTGLQSTTFVQPTAQLTQQVLSTQRNGFFRYITAVERNGSSCLTSLIIQHKGPSDTTGWPNLRENLDNYLTMANNIIDECNEITGRGISPSTASFSSVEGEEESRRKVDSGISWGSAASSNRNSGQSNSTRPSTSSSFSMHSAKQSKNTSLGEKPLPVPVESDNIAKPASSTLERIARELRKIKSKSNMRSESKHRPKASYSSVDEPMPDAIEHPGTPSRSLRLKKSFKNMRSSSALRENANSRPATPGRGNDSRQDVPAFDAEEMKQRRQAWEAQQSAKTSTDVVMLDNVYSVL